MHVSCAEALTLEAQERWKALHNEVRGRGMLIRVLHPRGTIVSMLAGRCGHQHLELLLPSALVYLRWCPLSRL